MVIALFRVAGLTRINGSALLLDGALFLAANFHSLIGSLAFAFFPCRSFFFLPRTVFRARFGWDARILCLVLSVGSYISFVSITNGNSSNRSIRHFFFSLMSISLHVSISLLYSSDISVVPMVSHGFPKLPDCCSIGEVFFDNFSYLLSSCLKHAAILIRCMLLQCTLKTI